MNGKSSEQGTSDETIQNNESEKSKGGRLWVSVFVLICVFSTSSWIDLFGVYLELPLMVNELPEGWDLPSYLTIVIQIANVGPISYIIIRKLFPGKIHEWHVIIIIISIGIIACMLLTFFWNVTMTTAGREWSAVLFLLSFTLAIVDCTSTLVYVPYMATFRPVYMVAMFIGEGLGGLISALLGIAQGTGGDPDCVNRTIITNDSIHYIIEAVYPPPRFSISIFYLCLFFILCITLIAFLFLHFYPGFETERNYRTKSGTIIQYPSTGEKDLEKLGVEITTGVEKGENYESSELITMVSMKQRLSLTGVTSDPTHSVPETKASDQLLAEYKAQNENGTSVKDNGNILFQDTVETEVRSKSSDSSDTSKSIDSAFYILLAITIWICILEYGFLACVFTYSCLPYGNRAYNLAIRLSALANCLVCFLALVVAVRSIRILMVLNAIASIFSVYHIVVASLSPRPPLQGEFMGEFLVISTMVLLTVFFIYTRLCCAIRLSADYGHRGLLWTGITIQVGCAVGAIFGFVLVTVCEIFSKLDDCV